MAVTGADSGLARRLLPMIRSNPNIHKIAKSATSWRLWTRAGVTINLQMTVLSFPVFHVEEKTCLSMLGACLKVLAACSEHHVSNPKSKRGISFAEFGHAMIREHVKARLARLSAIASKSRLHNSLRQWRCWRTFQRAGNNLRFMRASSP